ncbi:structural constituent of ribosome [Raphanus sativus]|uniref:Plant UBX domain-containing protein 16-like n=1 Tax=Raphanus sativus TaxID=3726 RepID=A0A6J0NAR5_RAPSA|nr:plant UBX domain-containing protein 16-like [Raphanus sativus]KAJ4904519.1 structural constituent of ribosome [Raphanus sativus]
MGIPFSSTNRVITDRSPLYEEINLFLNNETPQTLSTNPIEQQHEDQLISSFLEVAVGETVQTAKRFLETTNWNIEESINLFLLDKNYMEPSMYNEDHVAKQNNESTTFDDGESNSTLSSMYRPPVDLLFDGRTLEEAKSTSCTENLWLLVNLQSKTEFASHTLNRDLWSNDTVSEAVMSSFLLWQVYDNTIEGDKISNYYKIDSPPPVVLVIDPVTGQKMRMWSGVIEAQSFVEDLSWFLEAGPHEHIASLIRKRHPETEEDHTCSTSNNTDHVLAPSWGEECENRETWSPSNSNANMIASSWGPRFEEPEEVEKEENGFDNKETWSPRNSNDNIIDSSWGPRFEESEEVEEEENGFDNNETRSPSNNNDNTIASSWGARFEEPEEVEEEENWFEFQDLTEEPKVDCDKSVVCSVCVRFLDGRRRQRRFLKSEPVQLLWSFCYSHMEGFERKAFKLVQAIPGAPKTLDYGVNATFEESGLANSMISVAWE